MINYIKSNKQLFFLSLLMVTTLLCISITFVSSNFFASYYFNQVKSDTAVQSSLNSLNYEFWKYLFKSGESMSTYSKMLKASGKANLIVQLVENFFKGSTSSTNTSSDTSNLTSNFKMFNIWIQVCVALSGILLFSILSSVLLCSNILWRCFLLAKKFNFYKLFAVLLINVFGFALFYFEEKSMNELKKKQIMGDNEMLLNRKRKLFGLKTINNMFDKNYSSENILVIKNLFFSHQHRKIKHKTYSLKNVNLNIKRGSFNIVIGPNGSGKTTLIKSLINIYENIEGEIFWNGHPISKIDKTSFSQYVSYIPQILNLEQNITVPDLLRFSRYPYRNPIDNNEDEHEKIIIDSIKSGGCEELSPKNMDELSGGEKQRVLLAGILAQKSTEVIVLDEPTSFLDIKNQHKFLEKLKQFHSMGKTIIMILHDLQQAINYADNLIIMKNSCVRAEGHPKKIVTKELIRDVFSIDCDITNVNGKLKISNIQALEQ